MCNCNKQADMNDALSADLAEAQQELAEARRDLKNARKWVDILSDTTGQQDTALRAILEAVNQTDIPRLASSQARFKGAFQRMEARDANSGN
jgi:hypothetical protein